MTKRLRVKLTEMKDAAVDFISLVDRAASRMPVRIMKADQQEQQMLNLNDLRGMLARKSETPKPVITALVTLDHGEPVNLKVAETLKTLGFSVEQVTKAEDGSMIYAQAENATENARVLRMSDDLLLVVKGLDDADFGEVEGVLPGVASATEVLFKGVTEALAGEQDKAKDAIGALVKKYEQYVQTLATALPQSVFKADVEVAGAIKVAKAEVKKAEDAAAAEAAAAAAAQQAVEKKDMKKPDNVKQEDWDVMDDEAKMKACKSEAAPAAEAAPAVIPGLEDLIKSVAGLGDVVKDLVSKMDKTSTDIAELAKKQEASERRVDEAVQKADNAAQALKTTVLAPPQGGDTPAGGSQTPVKKGEESDPRVGNFDTAFIRRRTATR